MRVQLLGPVRIQQNDDRLRIPTAGQRAVLGLLGLAGGNPVSRAELIDALWHDGPPPSAVNVIQTHLKHLRRLLEPDRPARTPSAVLPSIGDGYVLHAPTGDVDVASFRQKLSAATVARRVGDHAGAAALIDSGLRLWRATTPLADVPALADHPKVVALIEERWAALGGYGEILMETGSHSEAVSILEEAALAQPLEEIAQARLIRAYLSAGRRAKAFEAYHMTRRRLAEELGIDPGPELAASYTVLLASDEPMVSRQADSMRSSRAPRILDRSKLQVCSLAHQNEPLPCRGSYRPSITRRGIAGTDRRQHVPANLPGDVTAFVGRQKELVELDRLLLSPEPVDGTAVLIAVLSGIAGVGKTALAIRWAHGVRDRFPDGQLYVDLRGYDSGRPLPVNDALARLLSALGLPSREIPEHIDDRIARYRTHISGRRLLIVLDNASSVEQVRPLLPGTSSCAVVVTSRESLGELVALHGARRSSLDTLPLSDAVTLLRRLIGNRVDVEPEAGAALAAHCVGLPLALRITAELATARPDTPLSRLLPSSGPNHRQPIDKKDLCVQDDFCDERPPVSGARRAGRDAA